MHIFKDKDTVIVTRVYVFNVTRKSHSHMSQKRKIDDIHSISTIHVNRVL